MKTRLGFVSNSSSSSFCIVGVPVIFYDTDWEDGLEEFIYKYGPSDFTVKDYDGTPYIGKTILDADDYALDTAEIVDVTNAEASVKSFIEMSDKLEQIGPALLISGTEYC